MDAKEFEATLEEWYLTEYKNHPYLNTYDLWAWGNFDTNLPLVYKGYRFEIVEMKDTGHREDFTDPEPVYYVVSVTDTYSGSEFTEYFRRDGAVQSFDGDEMSDWYKVTPRQKIVTVYE